MHSPRGNFVHDQLATERKLRILTVEDIFSRYCPVIDPRFSYRGEDVVATLDRVCRDIGYPKTIRVDNGSEFISRDMDLRACQRCVTLDFSRPGQPTDNSFIEAFNSKLRGECLNTHSSGRKADADRERDPSPSCPFLIICAVSILSRVAVPDLSDLKPVIGRGGPFTPR